MNKITNEQIQSRINSSIYASWAEVEKKIDIFRKKSNINTFAKLFGYQDGERLIQHYRVDCNYDMRKFLTYLTPPQKNELIVNCVENEDYLYYE